MPDIVFSGHVHNYQRFTRELDIGGKKYEIPYLVIGTGGHLKLHAMQKHNNGRSRIRVPFKLHDMDDVVLEKYYDDRYGFLRVRGSPKKLTGKFYPIISPFELRNKVAKKIDDFDLDID